MLRKTEKPILYVTLTSMAAESDEAPNWHLTFKVTICDLKAGEKGGPNLRPHLEITISASTVVRPAVWV